MNVLFNSPVPDEHKMYLEAKDTDISIIDYHKPNMVFHVEDGKITGLNDTRTINIVSYFIQELIDYIQKTETDKEKKQVVYDGIMGLLAAVADPNDDIKVGVPKIPGWMLKMLASSIILACTEMGYSNGVGVATNLMELFETEEYQGELYEAMDEGMIGLLIGYVTGFIRESVNN